MHVHQTHICGSAVPWDAHPDCLPTSCAGEASLDLVVALDSARSPSRDFHSHDHWRFGPSRAQCSCTNPQVAGHPRLQESHLGGNQKMPIASLTARTLSIAMLNLARLERNMSHHKSPEETVQAVLECSVTTPPCHSWAPAYGQPTNVDCSRHYHLLPIATANLYLKHSYSC